MSTLDAVLPLLLRDVDRFAVLARSLERNFEGMGTCFVVVPDRDIDAGSDAIFRAAGSVRVEIVPEGRWIPEMQSLRYLSGWYRQQLVKLTAAEHVASPYYMTLDADVVCTRRTTVGALLPQGRAGCYVIPEDLHPDWYEGAEAALDLRPRRRGILHNVTPVVWAKQGVLELIGHLNGVSARRAYGSGLRGIKQRVLFNLNRATRKRSPWRAWLAASWPWAEYALYFTFLEATGRFDRYHFESDYCIYDIGRSVWWKKDFPSFSPEPLFAGSGPPYFAVIQSNTQIPAAEVWQKLAPWLGEPPARARGAA